MSENPDPAEGQLDDEHAGAGEEVAVVTEAGDGVVEDQAGVADVDESQMDVAQNLEEMDQSHVDATSTGREEQVQPDVSADQIDTDMPEEEHQDGCVDDGGIGDAGETGTVEHETGTVEHNIAIELETTEDNPIIDVPIKTEADDGATEFEAAHDGGFYISNYEAGDETSTLPVVASVYSLDQESEEVKLALVSPKVEDEGESGTLIQLIDTPIISIHDGANVMININELGTPTRKSKRAPKPNRKYATDDESSGGEAHRVSSSKLMQSPNSKDQQRSEKRSKASSKIVTVDLSSEVGQRIMKAGSRSVPAKKTNGEVGGRRAASRTTVTSEDEDEDEVTDDDDVGDSTKSKARSHIRPRKPVSITTRTHTPANKTKPVKRPADPQASSSGRVRKMPKYMLDYELTSTKTVPERTDLESDNQEKRSVDKTSEKTKPLVWQTHGRKLLAAKGGRSGKGAVLKEKATGQEENLCEVEERGDDSQSDSTDSEGATHEPEEYENMKESELLDEGSRKRTCLYCPFRFTKVHRFTQHCRDAHKDMIEQKPRGIFYHCLYCNYLTAGVVKCQLHMTTKHRSQFTQEQLDAVFPYECPNKAVWNCKFRCSVERSLDSHLKKCCAADAEEKGQMKRWKQNPSLISSPNHLSTRAAECHRDCQGKKVHKCGLCSKTYPHHSVMVMHEAAHLVSGEGITEKSTGGHTCTECDKTFTAYHLLYAHMEVVHRGQEFRCPICNKLFTTKGYIRNHIESVHIAVRKHLCDTCGVSYKDSNTLRRHIKAHHPECADTLPQGTPRGKKPTVPWKRFMCQYCSMKFYTRAHCIAHQATHSGDKMYKCPVCNKLFAQEGTVHNHLYKFKVHKNVVREGFRFPRQDLLVKDGDLKMKPPIVLGSPSEGEKVALADAVTEDQVEENSELPSYLEVVWSVSKEDGTSLIDDNADEMPIKEEASVNETEMIESTDAAGEANAMDDATHEEDAGDEVDDNNDATDEVNATDDATNDVDATADVTGGVNGSDDIVKEVIAANDASSEVNAISDAIKDVTADDGAVDVEAAGDAAEVNATNDVAVVNDTVVALNEVTTIVDVTNEVITTDQTADEMTHGDAVDNGDAHVAMDVIESHIEEGEVVIAEEVIAISESQLGGNVVDVNQASVTGVSGEMDTLVGPLDTASTVDDTVVVPLGTANDTVIVPLGTASAADNTVVVPLATASAAVESETPGAVDQHGYRVQVKDSEILITQDLPEGGSRVALEQPLTGDQMLPIEMSEEAVILPSPADSQATVDTSLPAKEAKWSHHTETSSDIIQKAVESISHLSEEPLAPGRDDDLSDVFAVSVSVSPSTTVITVPPVRDRRPPLQPSQPRPLMTSQQSLVSAAVPAQPKSVAFQSILRPRLPATPTTSRGVRPLPAVTTVIPRPSQVRPRAVYASTVRATKNPQVMTTQTKQTLMQSVPQLPSDRVTTYLSKPPPRQAPKVLPQATTTIRVPVTKVLQAAQRMQAPQQSLVTQRLRAPQRLQAPKRFQAPSILQSNSSLLTSARPPIITSAAPRQPRLTVPKPIQVRGQAPVRPLTVARTPAPAPVRQLRAAPPPVRTPILPKIPAPPVQPQVPAPVAPPAVPTIPTQPPMTEVLVKRDANQDPNEPFITEELLEQISKFVPPGQKFLIKTEDGLEIIVDPTSAEPEEPPPPPPPPQQEIILEPELPAPAEELMMPGLEQEVTQEIIEQSDENTTLMMTNDTTTQQTVTMPQENIVFASADGGGGDGETVYVLADGVVGDQGNMMYVMQDGLDTSHMLPTTLAADSGGLEQQVVYMDASNIQMLDNGEMVFMQQVDQ